MNKLTVIKRAKLPSLNQIKAFEQTYSLNLPDAFVTFLLTQNPIYVEETDYPVDREESFEITVFYPFSETSEEYSLQRGAENLFRDFYEGKFLSFGGDSGGWDYVISVQEEDFGKIYFCRMDEALEDALTLVADSFEEFISGLRKSEE